MKVFVAGHNGLVGSEIAETFEAAGYEVVKRNRSELDLQQLQEVEDFFAKERPDGVILAAARVGGILANQSKPVDFLTDNLQIQTNVLLSSAQFGVRDLVFLSSSCVYPKLTAQPMQPNQLMSGYLEETNESYAIAKLAGMRLVESLNAQFGLQYTSVLPTNVYGHRDNFYNDDSHVLPAIIRKIHNSVISGQDSVTLWGSGKPLREFIHSKDLASAVLRIFETGKKPSRINVGSGEEVTIADLASMVADEFGFEGEIKWDSSMPDGTPRKLLDSTYLKGLGWDIQIPLRSGISEVIQRYQNEFVAEKR